MRKVLEKTMKDQRLLVSIVDDDQSVRESLPTLLGAFGFAACVFSSGKSFSDPATLTRPDASSLTSPCPE